MSATKILTLPSITATDEFVVPRSIPIMPFPAGFELDQNSILSTDTKDNNETVTLEQNMII